MDPDPDISPRLECNRVDGGGGTDIGEFTQSFDARRIDVVVNFRNENDFDLVNVSIHRNAVIGEVVVDITRVLFVMS